VAFKTSPGNLNDGLTRVFRTGDYTQQCIRPAVTKGGWNK